MACKRRSTVQKVRKNLFFGLKAKNVMAILQCLFSIIVKDILYDLPEIIGDVREEVEEAVKYKVIPITHYQRRMRKNSNEFRVLDHATRELKPIDQRRIEILFKLHPTIEICDWRFLRNRQETLSDGTRTLSLKYENNRPYGKVLDNPKSNTIIPWRYVKTGDKNGQFAGDKCLEQSFCT